MRFDEVELEAEPILEELPDPSPAASAAPSRIKQLLALLTDLSLFAALALALSPLLPDPARMWTTVALAGFVLMISFYYFVGAWMLWGRTIGGAIFDVRTPAQSLAQASRRWVLLLVVVGLLTASTVAWLSSRA